MTPLTARSSSSIYTVRRQVTHILRKLRKRLKCSLRSKKCISSPSARTRLQVADLLVATPEATPCTKAEVVIIVTIWQTKAPMPSRASQVPRTDLPTVSTGTFYYVRVCRTPPLWAKLCSNFQCLKALEHSITPVSSKPVKMYRNYITAMTAEQCSWWRSTENTRLLASGAIRQVQSTPSRFLSRFFVPHRDQVVSSSSPTFARSTRAVKTYPSCLTSVISDVFSCFQFALFVRSIPKTVVILFVWWRPSVYYYRFISTRNTLKHAHCIWLESKPAELFWTSWCFTQLDVSPYSNCTWLCLFSAASGILLSAFNIYGRDYSQTAELLTLLRELFTLFGITINDFKLITHPVDELEYLRMSLNACGELKLT